MALGKLDTKAVNYVVGLLEQRGVTRGFPHSSEIRGSQKIRELRGQSGGKPLRVFYAFDPHRRAVLLLGGSKRGDDRFYQKSVPRAEAIFDQYIKELSGKGRSR